GKCDLVRDDPAFLELLGKCAANAELGVAHEGAEDVLRDRAFPIGEDAVTVLAGDLTGRVGAGLCRAVRYQRVEVGLGQSLGHSPSWPQGATRRRMGRVPAMLRRPLSASVPKENINGARQRRYRAGSGSKTGAANKKPPRAVLSSERGTFRGNPPSNSGRRDEAIRHDEMHCP